MGYFDHLKQPTERALRAVPDAPIDPERASRYARKALTSECENVAAAAEGTRNHTLNRAAFSISQLVAAGHLAQDDAWGALMHAARVAGLGEEEIQATIASGFRAGAENPRVVPELPETPTPTVLDETTAEGQDGPESNAPMVNPILDWHDLFNSEDDGEEWILEPILPARRMVALYSAPKAGKSLLMLEIAVGIARGVEVIGAKPDPRRVLYVDFENDPRGDVRTRLEAMEVGPDELDNLCYLTFPSLAKFDTAQGAFDLLRHVQHYECEVVVIDTVSRAVAGEENENDTWLAFYRHTGLTLKQNGIACIRLDHSGKDRDKGMRGGSAKYGDVDAVWRLTAISEDTVHLECTDHRMQVPAKMLTLVREEFPLAHKLADGGAWQVAADARAHEADEVLDSLGVPSSASVREARAALREAGHKFRNKAIEDAVKLRKMRLDVTPSGVSRGHPGDTGGHRQEVSPVPSSRRGTGGHLPAMPRGQGDADPDEEVGCKSCFKPTTRAMADRNGGLCTECFRASGQIHAPTTED